MRLEVENTNLDTARNFVNDLNLKDGDVDETFPDFDRNYALLVRWATQGSTLRKDMPRIPRSQVKDFQKALEKGKLDVVAPFSPFTKAHGQFDSSADKKEFLRSGKNDGSKNDDKTTTTTKKIKAKSLKPIQKQIYLDSALAKIEKMGISGFMKMTKNANLIVSADNFIIDGHHRVATTLLIDPNIKLKSLVVNMNIADLLKLARAYGIAKGNKANESKMMTLRDFLIQI